MINLKSDQLEILLSVFSLVLWLYMDHDVWKSCLWGFLSGHTQTSILSYKVYLVYWNFARSCSKCRYNTFHLANKRRRWSDCADASVPFVVRKHRRHVFSLWGQQANSSSTKLLPQRLYCSFKFTNSAYCVALLNNFHYLHLLLSWTKYATQMKIWLCSFHVE